MSNFRLNWTPGSGVDSQNARYRVKGDSTWIDAINILDPNPQLAAETTADVQNISSNTLYEFQIESLDAGKTSAYSVIREAIDYTCVTPTKIAAGSTIRVNLPSALPTVDKIYFRLHNSGTDAVVQAKDCTGSIATVSFTGIAKGTYYVTFYMETVVNGITYSSIDQSGAWCQTSNVVLA